MSQISLTFPDGSARDFKSGVTGRDVAESIAKSLAKKAVAVQLDGKLRDLAAPIKQDARIRILTRDDPETLELIRHDAAHVMAEAVQELFPGTQITFGPSTEDGFYYDFHRDEPFTPEDFAAIEKRMAEIVARDEKIEREVWSRDAVRAFFTGKGETFS
jgi:threonyl-tRNA synthetase